MSSNLNLNVKCKILRTIELYFISMIWWTCHNWLSEFAIITGLCWQMASNYLRCGNTFMFLDAEVIILRKARNIYSLKILPVSLIERWEQELIHSCTGYSLFRKHIPLIHNSPREEVLSTVQGESVPFLIKRMASCFAFMVNLEEVLVQQSFQPMQYFEDFNQIRP